MILETKLTLCLTGYTSLVTVLFSAAPILACLLMGANEVWFSLRWWIKADLKSRR